jgi:hypothetical protein
MIIDTDLLHRFVADMAQGIYPYDVIAERYGFGDWETMFNFLSEAPPVRKLIQQHKAAYESNDAVQDRVRLKAGLATEASIARVQNLIMDPQTPNGQVLAGYEALAKTAGTYGNPPVPKEWGGGGGTGGPVLNVNFIYSDGRRETLTAMPIIEATRPAIEDAA